MGRFGPDGHSLDGSAGIAYHSPVFMKLACPKCQKAFPLTEDDAVLFYPRVFCLACGTAIPLPLSVDQHLALARKNDRDRKLDEKK